MTASRKAERLSGVGLAETVARGNRLYKGARYGENPKNGRSVKSAFWRAFNGIIPGRKTSENKADFLCALQENEKWSDGVFTSICAKKNNVK